MLLHLDSHLQEADSTYLPAGQAALFQIFPWLWAAYLHFMHACFHGTPAARTNTGACAGLTTLLPGQYCYMSAPVAATWTHAPDFIYDKPHLCTAACCPGHIVIGDLPFPIQPSLSCNSPRQGHHNHIAVATSDRSCCCSRKRCRAVCYQCCRSSCPARAILDGLCLPEWAL